MWSVVKINMATWLDPLAALLYAVRLISLRWKVNPSIRILIVIVYWVYIMCPCQALCDYIFIPHNKPRSEFKYHPYHVADKIDA